MKSSPENRTAEPKQQWTGTTTPALKLGSLQLQTLLSRELDEAHQLLDEWDRTITPGHSRSG
jgi:hypothetical protein